MKLFLLRHAKSEPRKKGWREHDLLRPLVPAGHEQAEAIAEHFAGQPLARIVSSPTLRCQQTLEPLTLASGIPVEVDERLGATESVQRILELFPADGEGPVLFCTHREQVLDLLRVFELDESDGDVATPCKKGSIWELEGPGVSPSRATYFEPVRRPGAGRPVRLAGPLTSRSASVRAAVLDLGSTSFHLLIAEVGSAGAIRRLVREKFMLRLGAVLATHAEIPEEVCKRAVRVARELRVVAEREKVQRIIPVATAALRDASNGAELADRISRALDLPVRILSGEEEARAIFRAFQSRVELGPGPTLGFDLGGGSLELAVGDREGIASETTLPLGVARLHGELVRHDPMRASEARRIGEAVRARLAPHRQAIPASVAARTAAAGGSVRALAGLLNERRPGRGPRPGLPCEVSVDSLRELCDELVRSTHEERLRMRGMRKRLADLLPTAALVVSTLVEELGIERLVVSDWGLREGVLIEAFGSGAAAGPAWSPS